MQQDTMQLSTSREETSALVNRLSQYEQLGQDVIMKKRTLVELDEARQKSREGLRQIRKKTEEMDDSSWLCIADTTFIKIPARQVVSFLEENIKTINETSDLIRNELKNEVDELRKMEGSKDLAELGFTLRSVC